MDHARVTTWTIAALGAAALAGGAWWLTAPRAHAADGATAAPAPVSHENGVAVVPERSALRRTIVVEPVSERSVAPSLVLPAVVEADAARLMKVLPPAAGRIVSLDKRLGDGVRAGDALLRLDAPDVAQARSDARKADAALALARSTLRRQQDLGADEIAAKRDIEQAQNDLEQASSEAARAAERLRQLGAGSAGAASMQRLVVRAPMSGHVVELNVAPGAYWNDPTAPLMTVADLSTLYVTAFVAEADLDAVFVGQPASVALDAYPGATFSGRVGYIGEILDPDTRRVKLRIAFDNRDGRLKPGMFARATLTGRTHAGLLVPPAAVVQSGFDSRVFVETQPWRFQPRVVKLGFKVGDRIEVVSGLHAGDRIVAKDGVLLDD